MYFMQQDVSSVRKRLDVHNNLLHKITQSSDIYKLCFAKFLLQVVSSLK